jgi:anti-sigma-K factor RskA
MSSEHVDDRADLYALGALDAGEIAAVDAHLRTCALCARQVGDAEAAVVSLVLGQPRHEAPPELSGRIERTLYGSRAAAPAFAALAAAFLFGFLPAAWFWNENRSMRDAVSVQSAAMERLAGGAHRTVAFSRMPQSSATVAYAPTGSWYVVLVKDASKALDVVWMHDGHKTMLGRAVPHDNVAMLYLAKSHRMDQLALVDGERVVAEASLSYP